MDRLDRMLALARKHVPNLRLKCKEDVPWMRALGVVLWPINPGFCSTYTTVVGTTIYLPVPEERIPRDQLTRTLAHELVHQLDMARYGVAFYVSYLVGPPGPVGRTRRAHWERRAYAVDLLLALEEGGPERVERLVTHLIPLFSGSAYGWMWAGKASAKAYLRPTVSGVLDGTLAQEEPYSAILSAWRGGRSDADRT